MENVIDAKGVCSAVSILKNEMDLLSYLEIKNVCLTVIQRYDKSQNSAKLTESAHNILEQVLDGRFVFRVSELKKLCESLMSGEG